MFRLGRAHDTWSYAATSSGSCVGVGVIWAALHRYGVVGRDSTVPGSSSSSSLKISCPPSLASMPSVLGALTCRTLDLAFEFIGGLMSLMSPTTLGVWSQAVPV